MAAGLACFLFLFAACGGDPAEEPSASGLAPKLADAEAFDEFNLYFVGDSFQGLPLTEVLTSEDFGYKNWSFIYGDCDPPSGFDAGGCSPPLEIQNWNICTRFPARYPGGKRNVSEPIPERGAQTLSAGGGLDVYTGKTTVVIFGGGQQEALRELSPVGRQASEILPEPASGSLEGELPCQARFVR